MKLNKPIVGIDAVADGVRKPGPAASRTVRIHRINVPFSNERFAGTHDVNEAHHHHYHERQDW